MDIFLLAAGLVALAEIGDKSQLLALALATRYRRLWAVSAGIACAALLSHALAGVVGVWLSQTLPEAVLRGFVGLAFIAMALWLLLPEKPEEGASDEAAPRAAFASALFTTALLFFLAELGDKTQVATVGLAARFDDAPLAVVLGSAAGMTLVSVPVVWLGGFYAARLPLTFLHRISAVLFAALGLATLLWG